MNEPRCKPELLCPAGSLDALRAAVTEGANAVYMGSTAFNARMHAKNFTADELRDGISFAHAHGARVYLTLNTLIYDKELDEALRTAEQAYLSGADALILADLGAADLIRRRIPIDLHASTQISGHNADAARRLAEAGFCRMVCAREMSRDELAALCADSPIEIEAFVHGALCVCHSGQCLFSSLVGGRSGNRGECAQPCRLPFAVGRSTAYPLSLKDMSLAAHLPELARMGVASLKIEGRMKSPDYVRQVTRIFRRLLDEERGASAEEMNRLTAVFSRSGLTDGYFTGTITNAMLGVRSEADKERSRSEAERQAESGTERKLPLSLHLSLRRGQPITLTLADKTHSVTVTGEIPADAITAPLNEDTLRRSIAKLGNTPYEAAEIILDADEGLMLPVSALNALRRRGIEALLSPAVPRSESELRPLTQADTQPPKFPAVPCRSAVFFRAERMPSEAREFFDRIYLPLSQYEGQTDGVLLPAVIFPTERETVKKALLLARSLGATHALFGNAGHLSLVREAGLIPHGDFRLNVTNRVAARYWQEAGITDLILSPELTLPRLRDIGGGAVVYGRIPLMVTEKCVGRAVADCKSCREDRVVLTDRRGVRFPVLREEPHRSLIVNSVPVYMADKQTELDRFGIVHRHFLFTTETKEEIVAVLRSYRTGKPAVGEIRRIK